MNQPLLSAEQSDYGYLFLRFEPKDLACIEENEKVGQLKCLRFGTIWGHYQILPLPKKLARCKCDCFRAESSGFCIVGFKLDQTFPLDLQSKVVMEAHLSDMNPKILHVPKMEG